MTPQLNAGKAQPEWVALFASDVHLSTALPRTTETFLSFLRDCAPRAQNLFLMGDLFEYWAGDDDIADPFHQEVCDHIHQVSKAGTQVFWLPGNRDFLTGQKFALATHATTLSEPTVLDLAGHRICLVHGDAECTDDHAYMQFRQQVRQTQWQDAFLARPLSERKAIIEGMRQQSQLQQQGKSYEIMDVHPAAINALFERTHADILIHGHTHRPQCHDHPQGTRYVLPDWECDVVPVRGGYLSLNQLGEFSFHNLSGQQSKDWQTAS